MNTTRQLSLKVLLAALASAFCAQQIAFAQEDIDEAAGQFPRQWVTENGSIIVHAPEIEAWPDFARVEARAAIEVTPAGDSEPTLGAVLLTANTETNLDLRLIAFDEMELTDISFPGVDSAERAAALESFIRETLPAAPTELPVEVVLSYISPDVVIPSVDGIQSTPPPIFYSTTPAILLQTDGEPLFAPIEDTRLQFVINTNWDLFRYRDREWYLLHDGYWLKSDSLNGPWDTFELAVGQTRKSAIHEMLQGHFCNTICINNTSGFFYVIYPITNI